MSEEQLPIQKSFKEISDGINQEYDNRILETINDHCLRMAVMEGEYRWHYHNQTDELFIVLEGELKIEMRDKPTLFLKPGEFITITAKTIHKTSAIDRTVNLTFERNADDTVFVE